MTSEYFSIIFVAGEGIVSALLFLILCPIMAYMMVVAFLQAGPFNSAGDDYAGVFTAFISSIGILAIVIGIVTRLTVGSKS